MGWAARVGQGRRGRRRVRRGRTGPRGVGATPEGHQASLRSLRWRTAGSIVTRVVADAEATTDRFAGLLRIGIARQISYKRGHKYLTVVVDHDSGVLLWARGLHGAEAVLKLREATSPTQQRRLGRVLALPPQPRRAAHPPIPLRRRRHPASRMTSLHTSRTHFLSCQTYIADGLARSLGERSLGDPTLTGGHRLRGHLAYALSLIHI